MAEIVLVRQEAAPIPPADADVARRVLFGVVDGLGERGKKQWRRFINGLLRLEPGEMVEIKTRKPRSGPFHRRHMKMEQVLFESQERFDIFDPVFRDWLKVGAGHVVWCPGPRGGVFPVPLSIDYDKLEDDEMREFHDKVVAFLRTEHAARTLYPHLRALDGMAAVGRVLEGFGE